MNTWIDLQINGYGGVDFNSPGLEPEAVRRVSERLFSEGTVGYLPTFVTGDPERVKRNLRAISIAKKRYAICERTIRGIHLEGPFISPEPGAVGAHMPEWVVPPDKRLFDEIQEAAEGEIRIITVAAEIPGMPEFIQAVAAEGVRVSLGHQMASTPAEIEPAIRAGASAFTHLGNGIPGMIPRHGNIIMTGLADERMKVMFIPDGHHLPDTLLKIYTRAVPPERLIAVSDAQFPAGMEPGEYFVCGSPARLEPDGLLWNPARNCLVGATAPMAAMMELLQERIGLTPGMCRKIGYENPLEFIS